MNPQSNSMPESISPQGTSEHGRASSVKAAARLIYWQIRREFWENRYLYIAPLAVAAVFLFAYLIGIIHSPEHLRAMPLADSPHIHDEISDPFGIAAGLMMGCSILMSVFYCTEAMHGERRDRSILFWKSLPVSDTTTVLAKASVPLLVLPLLVSAVTALLQFCMLLLNSVVQLATGGSVGALWSHAPLLQMTMLMAYHVLTAHALWPAPVYCWLLLVSGWARRAPFLWAVLPLVAIGGLEKIAFNTSHFVALVAERFIGSTAPISSTDVFPTNPMTHITPLAFLASPGLWGGLAVAAVFLAAAVRLRRSQGPI
jgi:ABC-2 type transport system permease protein